MAVPALRVVRLPPGLTWKALDGDVIAGEVSARIRPDGRCFVYFDTWRTSDYPVLVDTVARELGHDLYSSLDDAEFDALDALETAGFAVHRRESFYRIPTDLGVTGLADAVMPDGLEVISAADAEIDRLRELDDALRQDLPGSDGWKWEPEDFRDETFSWRFDPATYLVAVARPSGDYAGLVRAWRTRGGPRLGLVAMLAPYRRRGAARALLSHVFAVLSARGEPTVVAEADDQDVASVTLLTRLGARRYGGSVEMIRRHAVAASDE